MVILFRYLKSLSRVDILFLVSISISRGFLLLDPLPLQTRNLLLTTIVIVMSIVFIVWKIRLIKIVLMIWFVFGLLGLPIAVLDEGTQNLSLSPFSLASYFLLIISAFLLFLIPARK